MKFRMHPLFDMEGAIGAGDGGAAAALEGAAPSVAAGGQEPPVAGSAPAAAAPAEPHVPDVTGQESFAARLREEREKIENQYTPYKSQATQLETIAKAAGYANPVDYLNALDAFVREQNAEAEAQRLGVDRETYDQHFAPVHSRLQQTEHQLNTLVQADIERRIMADDSRLAEQFDDYKDLRDQVFDLAGQRQIPLEDAYKLLAFDSAREKAKLAGQAEAIRNISANAQSSPGAAGGDAPNQAFDFTKLTPEKRREYYEKAKRGELKSLS